MALKDWKNAGWHLNHHMLTYVNKHNHNQLDIIYGRGNLWYVQVEESTPIYYDTPRMNQLGFFKTKQKAISKAKSYMRSH